MKNIMVLNLGSTSFKFKLFEMDGHEKLLAQGSIDAIGSGTSALVVKIGEDKTQKTVDCPNHDQAFRLCMNELKSILPDLKALSAIGYKAVLAGEISGAQPITPEFLQKMEALVPLAPAHNPVYIDVMGSMLKSVPEVQQFACFETAFHATVPEKRAVYGVPQKWREWGIRRYGFHGASHSFIASETARLLPDARKVISVHLGGSCSICAIQDGRSVATSMGATPQSGLFHNNRVGDFDPFCFPLLEEKLGGTKQILQALSKESGLLGLSGVSNDLRKVEKAAEEGNAQAALAIDAFCDNITGYIGMFAAYMGGLDAIVFTGGIGEHSALVRRKAVESLGFLDIAISEAANQTNAPQISLPQSKVRVLVMETNEEIMIARQIAECLQ